MPLFRLSERIEFPPAWLARPDGLLCIGGDLCPTRLTLAYKRGIFPWFSNREPILWWSPDPRLVLFPSEIRVSKSLGKIIRKNCFSIRVNTAFEQTIVACSKPRQDKPDGTWLVDEMIDAYITLHKMGIAHSVEAWKNDQLVGGLYGVSLGKTFFGESMFSRVSNASKVALVALARELDCQGFGMIDCQVTSGHLLRMGAQEITRDRFLDILNHGINQKVPDSLWRSGRHIFPQIKTDSNPNRIAHAV
ncbi:leucyl/phenylalanyl-tRNA--protein transferase [uncultured Desulfobacter sp.]|uniref:leucyl/phenylalanyl-tRNA--protein transferase n=1 Tax=uncultured Desulfobacter sp. TaxID=240139 RepID=UPI0029F55AFB|nr:leucyl/phenylalanyl-tRNA--protein transferase [uncultured Desulfobacter sp.]